ncbi:hypothetical protein N9E56_02825 [Flavobacteriaceae bacterium]|nr:hypothetical protein [Flavobacteriaceae bacterium]
MSVSLTTTYAGEFSGKYIAAALLSADTLDKGLITIMPNVKYKSVIQKAATDDIVKDATCDFQTDAGTLTLTEAILEPKEFQVNLDICKKTLHDSWEAEQMGFSAFDNLAPNFADFVLGHVASKVADKTEKNIWNGDGAIPGEFDGFYKLLDADTNLPLAQDLTGGAITASNVIAELGAVVDAIPTTVYGSDDLYLYAASDVIRAYTRALGGFASQGEGANGFENKGTNQVLGNLYFDGIQVVAIKGAAAGTIIAAEKSNLFFGTGLLNDLNEVRVIDMAENDGSQNVRVVMRFTSGVQYAQVTDIVFRKTV